MNPIYGSLLRVFGLVLLGLVVWVLVQNTQDQKKNEALEAQMNELRRDLLTLSTSQAQSSTKMETIANTVATRLEAVTTAVQQGAKNSAEITSQITSQAQTAMSNELKNTREQITQIQQQLGAGAGIRPLDARGRHPARKYFGRHEIARQLRRNHPGTPAGRLHGCHRSTRSSTASAAAKRPTR